MVRSVSLGIAKSNQPLFRKHSLASPSPTALAPTLRYLAGGVFGVGGGSGEVVEEVEGGDGGALGLREAHEEPVAAQYGGAAVARPRARRARAVLRRRCATTLAATATRPAPPRCTKRRVSLRRRDRAH